MKWMDSPALSPAAVLWQPDQGGGQEKDGEDRECALFHKGSFKMR